MLAIWMSNGRTGPASFKISESLTSSPTIPIWFRWERRGAVIPAVPDGCVVLSVLVSGVFLEEFSYSNLKLAARKTHRVLGACRDSV